MKYVKVCEEEEEPAIELPLEEDNTLLLSTLTCQFSKATGLKYKTKETGIFRGVRFAADRFYSPPEGWDSYVYSCVLLKDNKRKGEDDNNSIPKTKKIDNKKCTDLIVLNIPWRTDDEALRMYFSKFGDVVMVQVKREPDTMKSKGYAFIRFAEYDAQVMCLAEQHCIDNRWCEVKIPYSKMAAENTELRNKIHVGRLSEAVTADVLRSFFNQYGKVESIYIPRPFRSFAFVTFEDETTAQNLLGRELKINDECLVTISAASPKINHGNQKGINGGGPQGYGHWNSYDDNRIGVMGGVGNIGGGGGMHRHRHGSHKLMATGSPQMPPDWPPASYIQQHQQQHHHHQSATGHHQRHAPPPPHHHPHHPHHHTGPQPHTAPQYPTAADMNQNTNAMATLNLMNPSSLLAALFGAATGRATEVGPTGHLMPPNAVSSGGLPGGPTAGGFITGGKPTDAMQHQQQQNASQQQQQTHQQYLYSHLPNQNNWGF